jgi:DNA replicative helicase MCM subunit Mcm2 (Cdc46/Mcm family)
MIRAATAHSKLRHSRSIERQDVEVARQLMLRIIDQSTSVGAGGEAADLVEDHDPLQPDEAAEEAIAAVAQRRSGCDADLLLLCPLGLDFGDM